MEQGRPLRVLVAVTTRYGKNGITGVVKNYAGAIDPACVTFDYALINLPEAAERAAITARGGEIFVYERRNRSPLAYLLWLKKVLQAGRYDIIHAHGNSATLFFEMLAGVLARVPVRIAHSHNTKTGFPLLHPPPCLRGCGGKVALWEKALHRDAQRHRHWALCLFSGGAGCRKGGPGPWGWLGLCPCGLLHPCKEP